MNDDRILLSETIERIGDAVDDIRTAVDMQSTGTIEDVADAVEALAGNEYNAYKVDTVLDMGRIDSSKLNDGDICVVMDNNRSYLPYRTNVLTRILVFPESFTATTTPEEFSDVNFGVYSNGNLVIAGGNVSLTNSGGGCTSGSGSGSGSGSPTLHFNLTFSSSATSKPCRNFSCSVSYSYDKDADIWTRADISSTDPVIGNTVILPLECGFNKTGGGNLPDIIFDCVKLPNYVADPIAAGRSATDSTTIDKSHVYDGFYLPYEVIYDGSDTPSLRWKNINPQETWMDIIKGTTGGAIKYTIMLTGSSFGLTGNIFYKQDTGNPTHYYLSNIVISNDKTNQTLYQYYNYNNNYPNYDIYLCLPEEYYADAVSGVVGFIGAFFNQISVEKPRTYRYDSESSYWKLQL